VPVSRIICRDRSRDAPGGQEHLFFAGYAARPWHHYWLDEPPIEGPDRCGGISFSEFSVSQIPAFVTHQKLCAPRCSATIRSPVLPHRVDSRLLLPARSRCLMKMLPVLFEENERRMEEALSLATRRELIEAVAGRYQAATRIEKKKILDEFIDVSGFHRKHAIRACKRHAGKSSEPPPRARIYDEAAVTALTILWEAADRICGKRLKEAIPKLVDAMERHGHLRLEPEVRSRVLAMSAATMDRALKPARDTGKQGRRRSGINNTPLRKSIAVLLMRPRNRSTVASKPERPRSPGRAWRKPGYWPCGVRGTSGVTLALALVRNLRTCSAVIREKAQAAAPRDRKY
jgi:hypothetical protein